MQRCLDGSFCWSTMYCYFQCSICSSTELPPLCKDNLIDHCIEQSNCLFLSSPLLSSLLIFVPRFFLGRAGGERSSLPLPFPPFPVPHSTCSEDVCHERYLAPLALPSWPRDKQISWLLVPLSFQAVKDSRRIATRSSAYILFSKQYVQYYNTQHYFQSKVPVFQGNKF